jgi:hypothetical protein
MIARLLRANKKSVFLLVVLAVVLGGLLLVSDPNLAPKFRYSFF